MGRLFVAVPPGPALTAWLRALPRPDRPGLRWTTESQWHLTVRFFGWLDAEAEKGARSRLSDLARAVPPVEARAGPRPVWLRAGIWAVPVEGLAALAGAVERATAEFGRAPPPRRFRGHLTLARARSEARTGDLEGPSIDAVWTVDSLRLVESTLRPEGALYREVGRWPLAGCPAG